MEAEAISIKIAESESSNYECVELVLAVLPQIFANKPGRGLWRPEKIMSSQTRGFRMLTDEEENLNKSLRQKQKVTGKWSQTCSLLMVRKELRDTHPQRSWQYYGYILSGCTKKDSTGYEPESLGYLYNILDRYLREMNYEFMGYMYSNINRHLRDMQCQSPGYMYNSLNRHLRYMKCPICGLHVQQPWQTLERHEMSISGLHVQQPWQTLDRHEM